MKREGLQRQTATHIYHRKHPRYQGALKTNAPTFEDEEEDQAYDDVWPPQLSSSARRYQELEEEFPDLPIRQHVPTQGRGFSPVPQRRSAPSPATSQPNLPPGVTIINGVPCVNVGGRWVEVEIVLHNGVPPPTQKQRGNKNKAHPPEIVYGLAAVGRETEQQRGPRSRFHWLVFVGMAVCTMLVGWILLTMLSQWWQVTTDDWHYGRPRTYQTDQAVGHGDSAAHPSHFIALNIRSHIEIIEFPGGDTSKARIYVGPTLLGQGNDLAAVTLTFRDVNGDSKLDMIVNVQESHFVFINDQGTFRPARPGENVSV